MPGICEQCNQLADGMKASGRAPCDGGWDVSYDHISLFEGISGRLRENPRSSLDRLSREFEVSRRTVQQIVKSRTGKSVSVFRDQLLIERVTCIFASQPSAPIKEISFTIGFASPRSFARAVKRACDLTPKQLRSRVACFAVGRRSAPRISGSCRLNA